MAGRRHGDTAWFTLLDASGSAAAQGLGEGQRPVPLPRMPGRSHVCVRAFARDADNEQASIDLIGWPAAGPGVLLARLRVIAGAGTLTGNPLAPATAPTETWQVCDVIEPLGGLARPIVRCDPSDGAALAWVPLCDHSYVQARCHAIDTAARVLVAGAWADDPPSDAAESRLFLDAAGGNISAGAAGTFTFKVPVRQVGILSLTGDYVYPLFPRAGGTLGTAAATLCDDRIASGGPIQWYPGERRVSIFSVAAATYGSNLFVIGIL